MRSTGERAVLATSRGHGQRRWSSQAQGGERSALLVSVGSLTHLHEHGHIRVRRAHSFLTDGLRLALDAAVGFAGIES